MKSSSSSSVHNRRRGFKAGSREAVEASRKARACVVNQLREAFDEFLDDANGEELWFLSDVLASRSSFSFTGEASIENSIASALSFYFAERAETYFHVGDGTLKTLVYYLGELDDDALNKLLLDIARQWKASGGKFLLEAHGWRVWNGRTQTDGAK